MTGSPALLELLLRGMAIGATAAMAIAFLHGGAGRAVRIAAPLFCISLVGYVLNSSPAICAALGAGSWVATLPALGGGGWFWLFVVVLFEDRRISARGLAPALLLTVVGLAGVAAPPSLARAIWILHNGIEIVLCGHLLYLIERSWRGDLVEARRRLRGPFMAIVTVYAVVLAGIEIGESLGVRAAWYPLAGAFTMALFCTAGAMCFLQARQALFGAAQLAGRGAEGGGGAAAATDPADRITLEQLRQAMDRDAVWKDENLSIGRLAERLAVPEYRLRRLINDVLGHRNFAAFVNARRIEAACSALADPARARTTVAAIAYEHGFNSLGPFNRAFRETTGRTPTEWRREALAGGSPKPEIPR